MDRMSFEATLREINRPNRGQSLPLSAKLWQTISVADVEGGGGRMSRSGGRSDELLIKGQAALWATATARDWKDGACKNANVETNALLGRQAVRCSFLLRQQTTTDGHSCIMRLNPLFVEWLMGVPFGWTDFEPLAMDAFRQWWHTHSSHLQRLLHVDEGHRFG